MKKTLLQKIGVPIVAIGTTLASLGCMSTNVKKPEIVESRNKYGYVVGLGLKYFLYSVAGIESGDLEVKKTSDGEYISEGSFSIYDQEDLIARVHKMADTNEDKKITFDEATDLLHSTMEKAAQ